METRANFILIGAFTILGILGALGFFVWLASVQIDRQYAQYGVLFDNVSGLDASGDVLFNGVAVGTVLAIRIWEEDPSLVFVEVEVDAETPVSSGTVAQLNSQGVTGVAYIELSGGAADAAPLEVPATGPPIIPSRRSTVQALVADAPDMLADAALVMSQIQELTGPENQAYVASILRNLDATSGQLEAALADLSEITGTVREAVDQITVFTTSLDGIGASVTTTLAGADETLAAATGAFDEADRVLEGATAAIASAQDAFAAAQGLLEADVPVLAGQVGTALGTLESAVSDVAERSATSFDLFDTAAADASGAFTAASGLMDTDLAPVLGSIEAAATDIRTLTTRLAEDIPAVTTRLAEEIPALTEDLRAVIARAQAIADDIGAAVDGSAPGLAAFSTTGLGQITQLSQEARDLVAAMNDLVRQIDNNPTRFLLDDRVPEYRR